MYRRSLNLSGSSARACGLPRAPGLVEEGMVRCQPASVQHPYHLTLRAQGLLAPPSRDPADFGGLADQCGAVGRAVAEGGAAMLAGHT